MVEEKSPLLKSKSQLKSDEKPARICAKLLPHTAPHSKRSSRQYWCCGITNLILPGVGAIILGLVEECGRYMLIGGLQLILAPLVIGWLWAIVFGIYLILLAYAKKSKRSRTKPRSDRKISRGNFSVPTVVNIYNP
eukprot:Lankesteria_metandrocarpae@DN4641_c0_g1_i2.p1